MLPFGYEHFLGMEDLTLIAIQPEISLIDIVPNIQEWDDLAGALFDLADPRTDPSPDILADTHLRYYFAVHPNSLIVERMRVTVEAYPIGTQPLVGVGFGVDGMIQPTPSIPVLINDTVSRYEFTIVRPADGLPLGAYLDMFQLEIRDVIVTRFEVVDLGVKGDLNLDQQVNILDLGVVAQNLNTTGNVGVENGDANLDGVVDSADAIVVIQGMPE